MRKILYGFFFFFSLTVKSHYHYKIFSSSGILTACYEFSQEKAPKFSKEFLKHENMHLEEGLGECERKNALSCSQMLEGPPKGTCYGAEDKLIFLFEEKIRTSFVFYLKENPNLKTREKIEAFKKEAKKGCSIFSGIFYDHEQSK